MRFSDKHDGNADRITIISKKDSSVFTMLFQQRSRGAEEQRSRGAESREQRSRGAEEQSHKNVIFLNKSITTPKEAKIHVLILICVHLRSSVFICGKKLTNDDNRKFDDITHVLTM